MTESTYEYDPAQSLEGPKAIALFLADALDTGDAVYIAKAMGVAARTKGLTELARETGLSTEHLHESFGESGNPTLKTMLIVMKALGVGLTAQVHEQKHEFSA